MQGIGKKIKITCAIMDMQQNSDKMIDKISIEEGFFKDNTLKIGRVLSTDEKEEEYVWLEEGQIKEEWEQNH